MHLRIKHAILHSVQERNSLYTNLVGLLFAPPLLLTLTVIIHLFLFVHGHDCGVYAQVVARLAEGFVHPAEYIKMYDQYDDYVMQVVSTLTGIPVQYASFPLSWKDRNNCCCCIPSPVCL